MSRIQLLLILAAATLVNLGLWVAGVDGPWQRAGATALLLSGVVLLVAALDLDKDGDR